MGRGAGELPLREQIFRKVSSFPEFNTLKIEGNQNQLVTDGVDRRDFLTCLGKGVVVERPLFLNSDCGAIFNVLTAAPLVQKPG